MKQLNEFLNEGKYQKVWQTEKYINADGIELVDKLEKLTLENTNISKKQLKKVYKRKLDWYLESDEALELGVVDEII